MEVMVGIGFEEDRGYIWFVFFFIVVVSSDEKIG